VDNTSHLNLITHRRFLAPVCVQKFCLTCGNDYIAEEQRAFLALYQFMHAVIATTASDSAKIQIWPTAYCVEFKTAGPLSGRLVMAFTKTLAVYGIRIP